jgi:hypothetical protein
MNYQRIYDEIIERAKLRGLDKKFFDGYFERHHIIPLCMHGTNDKSNLVLLTAREHYLCHYILMKIHNNDLILYAFQSMQMKSKTTKHRYVSLSSKQYEILKNKMSVLMKTKMTNREPWNKGLTNVYSEEVKGQISNTLKGRKMPLNVKNKIKNSMIGVHVGHKHSDEFKLQCSLNKIGKKLTTEHKMKIKEGLKRRRILCQNLQKN